jgi:hypothetical protein
MGETSQPTDDEREIAGMIAKNIVKMARQGLIQAGRSWTQDECDIDVKRGTIAAMVAARTRTCDQLLNEMKRRDRTN